METCNRPVLIQYTGSGSLATTLVQIEIEVREKINGTFTYIKKGTPMIQGRDLGSTESAPVFTFDISAVLKSGLSRDVDFDLFNTANANVGFSRVADFPLTAMYKVTASSWYVDAVTGVLTFNDIDDALFTGQGELLVCDVYIPDREVLEGVYSNMVAASPLLSGWHVNQELSASGSCSDNMRFLTNCPSGYRRIIPSGYPLSLSAMSNDADQNWSLKLSGKKDNGAAFDMSVLTSFFIQEGVSDIKTANLTVNDTYLFNNITGATLTGVKSNNVSLFFNEANLGNSRTWDFEIVDKGASTNDSFRSLPKAETIYFVNDYNVLDFFTFESNLGVAHAHSKQSFKSGYKDYKNRGSSKFGVSRGQTEEVMSLSAVVNREVSEWLSELYRSTDAFIYETGLDGVGRFCPIRVVDGDTIPLPQDRKSLEQFSISFIKDTYTVNK
tara:strand:+ start:5368 stop:6690 length:1323 start_codon:yes stop_codon:yes gene_type:complete